jgi:hypothetical protein
MTDLLHEIKNLILRGYGYSDAPPWVTRCSTRSTPSSPGSSATPISTGTRSCGVYGFYTIDHLLTQYPDHACRIVAVITIRGRILLDNKGLRATAARVVAYWCAEDAEAEAAVCANDCPGARRFYDRDVMTQMYELTGQPPV